MDHFLLAFQTHAMRFPNKTACIFLENGELETASVTYGELDQKAKAIAVYLQQLEIKSQQCVALLYPSGIEFIAAFIGCLYADLIAVPLSYPTKSNFQSIAPTLKTIVEHSSASGILTTKQFIDTHINTDSPRIFTDQPFWDTTKIDLKLGENFCESSIDPNKIACLQYTSGSTSNPKGVVITHSNLDSGLIGTAKIWDYSADSISLMWLSHAHIYGLTAGLLTPLMVGALCIIMPAMTCVSSPIRWLRAIYNYKVTHSGCPNFGYQLCLDQIKDHQLMNVDLSSWKIAVNGGEPIQPITLELFCERFSTYGFQQSSFCPAYGMSEMTGLIATTKASEIANYYERPTTESDQSNIIQQQNNTKQKLISCGKPLPEISVKIIHPETLELVAEGKIGELCLAGPMCSASYWKQREDKAQFITLVDKNEQKKYLRTGDLGFMRNGELVLTGRLKEVIVIAGKNYEAFDLEVTIGNAHPKLNQDNVAFSLCQGHQEKLFIVQEISAVEKNDYEEMIMAIRRSVSEQHNLDIQGILFTERGALPKTISGKKKRYLCKEHYLNNKLEILYQDIKSYE